MFLQPPYVLGFPNIRGSCYLIAALTSVLHLYPFIYRLYRVHAEIRQKTNAGHGDTTKDEAVDGKFHWTKLLYKIYNKYYKVSVKGRLSLENVRARAERLQIAPIVFTPYSDAQDDIVLDDLLISKLCVSMRDFCDSDYGIPGGLVDKAYRQIITKLTSEHSGWINDFYLQLTCSTVCDSCNRTVADAKYRIAVLALPIDCSFQKALFSLESTIKAQQLHCRALIHGVQCNGFVRDASNVTLKQVPEVICFNVDYRQVDRFEIPDNLVLPCQNYRFLYSRIVNSNSITCYRSRDGIDYGDMYHKYEEGDIVVGHHTFLTFKTPSGLYDVNNGKIYTCHKDLKDNVTEDSLHIYQRTKYDGLNSSINPSSLINLPPL